jgi:hypothetical protein
MTCQYYAPADVFRVAMLWGSVLGLSVGLALAGLLASVAWLRESARRRKTGLQVVSSYPRLEISP